MSDQDEPTHDDPQHDEGRHDEGRRGLTKLVGSLQDEASKVARSVLERKPPGQESIERILDVFLKVLNRREVLERILRSDFMKNVRDMQSEITEAIGIASQADAQELRQQLAEVNERLEKLQKTLDEIVVEVEDVK
ncbi:MAG: hypothetical protein CMH57_06775 [Myxococcales bacterium]|nr:hypothetical protein [Myxococcales bacterium]